MHTNLVIEPNSEYCRKDYGHPQANVGSGNGGIFFEISVACFQIDMELEGPILAG